jgi:hypothetical protein
MHKGHLARALIVAGLLTAFVACEEDVPLQTESKVIPAGEAKSADVTLNMGAGRLRLEGGAAQLLEGTFRFRRERYRPEFDYHVVAERGELVVRHRRRLGFFNSGATLGSHLSGCPSAWRHRPAPGESRAAGHRHGRRRDDPRFAGSADEGLQGVDRRRRRERRIYLPTDVGVRVHVDGGLGSIHADGLVKNGDYYVNDAYGRAPVTLDVRVDAGIGSLELRATGGKTGRSI